MVCGVSSEAEHPVTAAQPNGIAMERMSVPIPAFISRAFRLINESGAVMWVNTGS
jgi:hypothetical protein